MTEVLVVRNDTKYPLQFELRNADGDIIDLTGSSTILLKIQKDNQDSLWCTIQGTALQPPTAGIVSFTINQEFIEGGDSGKFVNVVGKYSAEIEVFYLSSGQTITATDIHIECIPDLPKKVKG